MGVYKSYLRVRDINVDKLEEILENMQLFSDCNPISKSRAVESFLKLIGMKEYKRGREKCILVEDDILDIDLKESISKADLLNTYKSFLGYDEYRIYMSGHNRANDNSMVALYSISLGNRYKKRVSTDLVLLMMAVFILENSDKSYDSFLEALGKERSSEDEEFYGMFIRPFKKCLIKHKNEIPESSKDKSIGYVSKSLCDDCVHRRVCMYCSSIKYIDTNVFNITCKYKE